MPSVYMDVLSYYSEGVQDFRVVGDPSSRVEVRINRFPVVLIYGFSVT